MKTFKLIIGGNYFTPERVRFFDNPAYHEISSRIDRDTVEWDRVASGSPVPFGSDAAVIFGLKTWTRRARKQFKAGWREIVPQIQKFVKRTVGDAPIGVVDDLAIDEQRQFGRSVRKMFFDNFDCRFYLIREGLITEKYDPRVRPFTMSAVDMTHLVKPAKDKSLDVFFRGNSSADDRVSSFKAVRKMTGTKSDILMYDGGDHAKERLPFDAFMARMADSRFGLHFMGTGYCCYRYQEIASVGSIIVSPKYPHLVQNDYVDMRSCVTYSSVDELRQKLSDLLASPDRVQEMQDASVENFKKYHTTEMRFRQFANALTLLEK